jgi:uncharacterized membrane protein YjjP (DUF1212 family)
MPFKNKKKVNIKNIGRRGGLPIEENAITVEIIIIKLEEQEPNVQIGISKSHHQMEYFNFFGNS